MKEALALAEAVDTSLFGSKAVGLGQALRDGLTVPPGVALSGAIVEAVAAGEEEAIATPKQRASALRATIENVTGGPPAGRRPPPH